MESSSSMNTAVQPAATVQRGARECTEERGRGRRTVPPGQVECVCHWSSRCLHRTATQICCMLDTQGRWCKAHWSMCEGSLCTRGGWVSPGQKLGYDQTTLQICVSSGYQVSWVLLSPKYTLETQIAAMFCCKHLFHYRNMFRFQSQGLARQWKLIKNQLISLVERLHDWLQQYWHKTQGHSVFLLPLSVCRWEARRLVLLPSLRKGWARQDGCWYNLCNE